MNRGVDVALQVATSERDVPQGADWQAWVNAALDAAGIDARAAGCMTLRLVGRSESRHLNELYRHKSGATNVLAFPGHDKGVVPDAERELGDLVICLPVVHEEAREQNKASLAHLAHLVVHGTLHLSGFDHDNDVAAARMESLETRVMLGLGFPAPYPADECGAAADDNGGG